MGIFLKLTAVLGHALCQQKEKRFVLVAAEYRCLSLGLSPGYQGSVAAKRKEEEGEWNFNITSLPVPGMQERLEPMQQATAPVQLSPGFATWAKGVGTLSSHSDGSPVTSGSFKSSLVNSTSGVLFDTKTSV